MEEPTTLWSAAQEGNLALVKELLQKPDVNIDERDAEKGRTALFLAVVNKREAVVEFLLQNNANVNIPNNEGDTPLHIASQNDLIRLATLLAQNGADLYKENGRGWNALEKASKSLKQNLLDGSERFRIKSQTDPAFCTVEGEGLIRAVSGTPTRFRLQAKNGFDKVVIKGGDNFAVSITICTESEKLPCTATITDKNDGTYLVEYIPVLPGDYFIDITLFGGPVKGCPYKCKVTGEYADLVKTLRWYYTRSKELEEAVAKNEQRVEDISRNRRALDETKIRLEEKADGLKQKNKELEVLLKEASSESSRKDKIINLKDTEIDELRKQFGLTGVGRTVVRQDWATKRGKKVQNWKRRYCVLFGDRKLEYYEIKGSVDLTKLTDVSKSNQGPHCLCITTRDRKPFFIRFDSEEVQDLWLESLQRMLDLSSEAPLGGEHFGDEKLNGDTPSPVLMTRERSTSVQNPTPTGVPGPKKRAVDY